MIRTTQIKKTILAAVILSGTIAAQAGTLVTGKFDTISAPGAPDVNPLSMLGGAVVFDIHERLRFEARENNFDFNGATDALTDDSWLLQRARIGLLIKPCDWFKVYAQGQDAREIGSDRPDIPGQLGAEGDDSFDLRQAWVELGNAKSFPLTAKIGRQTLSYGDERIIGLSDWGNFGRTFDAVKLRWEEKSWSLDAFASSVVVPERGSYNQSDLFDGNETGREQVFNGLYFSTTACRLQTIDVYALHLHENPNPRYQPNAIGDTNFATFGLRIKSKPGVFARHAEEAAPDGKSAPAPHPTSGPAGFDYDFEGAFQTGEVRGLDLTAFAVHAGLGYTFTAPWKPRLGVEYNFGSGDHDPLDGNRETFQNLFPTNHRQYGIMDLTSWQNMHHAAAELKLQPCKPLTAQLGYRAFFIASTDDVWYRSNGTTAVRPLTPAARNASNYEGSQVDVVLTWNVQKNLQLQGGYAHFFAGSYLADTGAHDDADFGYVQAMLNF